MKDGVIVKDSDKDLKDNWKEKLKKTNVNTKYNWDQNDGDLRAYEEHEEHDIANEKTPEEVNDDNDNENSKEKTSQKETNSKNKKPKRVLVYTTKKLLKQLAKNLKTSLDGTFKSCCKLWGQSFIWVFKQRGYWVPVCWGWLPDKTELSFYTICPILVNFL